MSLQQYRHPNADFTLPVPPEWEHVEDPQEGVAFVVVEPPGEVDFRANLVVTVEDIPDDYDLDRWQRAAEQLLPGQLPNLMVLDRELIETDDDRQLLRRLAHYVADDTGPVTMEQWAVLVDGRGYTLTASIATLSYDSLADVFAEMALRFRAGEEAA